MVRVLPTLKHALYMDWNGLKGNTFDVLRSGSPASEFEVVASDLTVPFYVDTTVNLYDEGNRYYYQIQSKQDGQIVDETHWNTEEYGQPDGVARVVIHESEVVLKVMNNPLVYLLIKKRFAEPCPECWNPITQRTRYANCPVCFGTGQLAGYFTPVPMRISRDISILVGNSTILDADAVNLSPINAWAAVTPLVTPGDVMVDVLNKRYVVQQVAPRTKSGCVIRQILQLTPLEKGHPAYNFPVDRSVSLR